MSKTFYLSIYGMLRVFFNEEFAVMYSYPNLKWFLSQSHKPTLNLDKNTLQYFKKAFCG